MRVRRLILALCLMAVAVGCGDTESRPVPTTQCYPLWDACLAEPQTIEASD